MPERLNWCILAACVTCNLAYLTQIDHQIESEIDRNQNFSDISAGLAVPVRSTIGTGYELPIAGPQCVRVA